MISNKIRIRIASGPRVGEIISIPDWTVTLRMIDPQDENFEHHYKVNVDKLEAEYWHTTPTMAWMYTK